MDLRELELFGTLMRVGTTIETARLLGISQPSVSGQLKRLESRLGFSLFHRTGNRLEPTREANELFALSMPIFTCALNYPPCVIARPAQWRFLQRQHSLKVLSDRCFLMQVTVTGDSAYF